MKKLQMYHTAVTTLVVVGIIIGVIALFYVKNSEAVDYTIFTLRTANFAIEMDKLYDSLPDVPMEMDSGGLVGDRVYVQWGVVTNSLELEQVTEAVLPYWDYEFGIRPVHIRLAGFIPFSTGKESFHVLGQACCVNRLYIINYGYVNPYGHIYRDDSLLPTIVHEIGHTQGICTRQGGSPSIMEAANQVATYEVLAAMANHGNAYAIKPLVGELRDAALGYVKAVTREQGREDWYRRFVMFYIYETEQERARAEKSWRFWSNKQEELDHIIRSYSMRPWYRLYEALNSPDYRTPKNFWPYPNASRTIRVDDLAYFLNHLDQAARMANSPQ